MLVGPGVYLRVLEDFHTRQPEALNASFEAAQAAIRYGTNKAFHAEANDVEHMSPTFCRKVF